MAKEQTDRAGRNDELFEPVKGKVSAVSSGRTRMFDVKRGRWLKDVEENLFLPAEEDLLGQEGMAPKGVGFDSLDQLTRNFAPIAPGRYLLRYVCYTRGLQIMKEDAGELYKGMKNGRITAALPDPSMLSRTQRIFSAAAQMMADTFSENGMPAKYCRIEYVRGLLLSPSEADLLDVIAPGLAMSREDTDLFLTRAYGRSGLDYYDRREFLLALVLQDAAIGLEPFAKLQRLQDAYARLFTEEVSPEEERAAALFDRKPAGTVPLLETGSRCLKAWLAEQGGKTGKEAAQLFWHTQEGYTLSPFFRAYLKWYARLEKPSVRTAERVFREALGRTKALYADEVEKFRAVTGAGTSIDKSDPDWIRNLKPRQLHVRAAAYVTIRYHAEEGLRIPKGSIFFRDAMKNEKTPDGKVRFVTKRDWLLAPAADEMTLTGEVEPCSPAPADAAGKKVFLRQQDGPAFLGFAQPREGRIISVVAKDKVRRYAPTAPDGTLEVSAVSGTDLAPGSVFVLREGDDVYRFETTKRTVFWPRVEIAVKALTDIAKRRNASRMVIGAGETDVLFPEEHGEDIAGLTAAGSLPLYADDLGVLEVSCAPGTRIEKGQRFSWREAGNVYEYEVTQTVCAAPEEKSKEGARLFVPVRALAESALHPEQNELRVGAGAVGEWAAPRELEAAGKEIRLSSNNRNRDIARFRDEASLGMVGAVCRPGTRIRAGEIIRHRSGEQEFVFLVLADVHAPDETDSLTMRSAVVNVRALEKREDHPKGHPALVDVTETVLCEPPEDLRGSITSAKVLKGTNYFAPDGIGTVEIKAVPGTVLPAGTRFTFRDGEEELVYTLCRSVYACTPLQVPVRALSPRPEGAPSGRRAMISVKRPCFMETVSAEASIYEIRVEGGVPLYAGTRQEGTVLVRAKAGTVIAAGTRFSCVYGGETLLYETTQPVTVGEYASDRVLVYATDRNAGKKASHGQGYEIAATGSICGMEERPEAIVQIFNEKPLIYKMEDLRDTWDDEAVTRRAPGGPARREVPDDAFFRYLNEDMSVWDDELFSGMGKKKVNVLLQRLRILGFAQTRLDANVVHNFAAKTDEQKRTYLLTLTFLEYSAKLGEASRDTYERREILNEFESAVDQVMEACRYPLYYRGRFYDCLLSYLLLYGEPVLMLRILWLFMREAGKENEGEENE